MKEMRTRITHEYEHYLDATCEKVFPLLCPIREYEWIPHWQCDMIYTKSGVAELGCVFTTDYDKKLGLETWVIFCYKPAERIGFVRTGKHRTTRYEIVLQPKDNGTLIRWQQEITALDSRGDEIVAEFNRERYEALMIPLNQMLAHYLETGKSLELPLDI